MISHKYKLLYIDITKTGSSSIRASLEDVYPQRRKSLISGKFIQVWDDLNIDQSNPTKHHQVNNWTANKPWCSRVTPEILEEYFTFATVRNPYDRFVSLYHMDINIEAEEGGRRTFENYIDFSIKRHEEHDMASKWYLHREPVGDESHSTARLIPQKYWLVTNDGVDHTDFLMRFESLDEDWVRLVLRLKYRSLGGEEVLYRDLPKMFTAMLHDPQGLGRKHYRDGYYNARSKRIVREFYEEDFEYFGYDW